MMAEITSAKKDGKDKSTKDKLFDPSIDMLINDFDDERTIEEEEALAAGESQDPNTELTSLQKEGNMPLEELLVLYGYKEKNQENGDSIEEDAEQSEPMEEQEIDPLIPDDQNQPSKQHILDDEPKPENDRDPPRLLRLFSTVSHINEEDYKDDDDWRKVSKTIMVGNDYQAQIPDDLCHYDDALPYENEDKLLWDPFMIESDLAEEYLGKAAEISKPIIPMGHHLRDNEQALYLLQQCGHNSEEALRRVRMNVVASSENMSLWSEEECRNFESGIRSYGKDFHSIQRMKVRTRSVGELVQFYYLWKKSERHDMFANKIRLEKKKNTLHPDLTDFMDRFLDEQDSRDRSSSPNVQYVSEFNKKSMSENSI